MHITCCGGQVGNGEQLEADSQQPYIYKISLPTPSAITDAPTETNAQTTTTEATTTTNEAPTTTTTTSYAPIKTRKPKDLWHSCQWGSMPSELNLF